MNDKHFFGEVSLGARMAGFAILLGPLIALGVIFAVTTKPTPFPKSAMFGCYATDPAGLSPPIYIDADAIHIVSDEGLVIGYSITNYRGYVLEAGPGSFLMPAGDNKYAFDTASPHGQIWGLGPSHDANGKGLSDFEDFDGSIAIVANDGTKIVYRRSNNPTDCNLRTNA